jgi:hypothetical protein
MVHRRGYPKHRYTAPKGSKEAMELLLDVENSDSKIGHGDISADEPMVRPLGEAGFCRSARCGQKRGHNNVETK